MITDVNIDELTVRIHAQQHMRVQDLSGDPNNSLLFLISFLISSVIRRYASR